MTELTYSAIIRVAKLGFRALGQKITFAGLEHLPRTGGALVAVNHISYVDFIYGGLAANPSGRKVRFMSKRELFDHKYTGPLMRSLHHIEVDRGAGTSSYDTAVDYLLAGEAVGIFPEATISRSMELKEFKTGAVRIAAAAGVPLVPVVLWGTQRMMTKDHPLLGKLNDALSAMKKDGTLAAIHKKWFGSDAPADSSTMKEMPLPKA